MKYCSPIPPKKVYKKKKTFSIHQVELHTDYRGRVTEEKEKKKSTTLYSLPTEE